MGIERHDGSPEDFGKHIRAEHER